MKLLIVDDEANVREGLVKKVEYILNKKFFILEAGEVQEAIKIIRKHQPEIIISDIRLHEHTGLDMIRQITDKDYNPQVIIISGYSEFAYAQEAIDLGVIKYIIKPIDYGKMSDAIEEAVKNIQQSYASEQVFQEQKQENYLKKIFSEKNVYIEAEEIFEKGYENLFLLAMKPSTGYHNAISHVNSLLSMYLFKSIDVPFDFVSKVIDGNKIIYLVGADNKVASILPYFEKVLSKVSYELGTKIYAGISQDLEGVSLSNKYIQSRVALSNRLFYPANQILQYQDNFIIETTIELPTEKFQRIVEALESNILQEALDDMEEIFGNHSKPKYNNLRRLYESFINYIFMHVVNPNKYLREDRSITNIFIYDFNAYDSIDEMIIKIKKMLFVVCQALAKTKENTYQNIGMLKAETYIKNNYNKEISLQDVAKHVAISYTYFSKLFKEETGETFSEYLKRLRMSQAKKLLCNPKLTIKEIAIEVGYTNPRHFSKVFENQVGVKPSLYRKRVILGHV